MNTADADRLFELGRMGSKGWCYIRGATTVLIGLVLFVTGLILRVMHEKREKISVTISSVKSSHRKVEHAVKGLSSTEEVVSANRVPGTSHEECRTTSGSHFESCTCSGYSYESEDKTRVECPGHRGRCDSNRNHIVKRTSEDGASSLRCGSDDMVTCAFELAPLVEHGETSKSFPLTCNMSKRCQTSGNMKLPVTNSPPYVASCPADKWNMCSMTFMFEGNKRAIDVQMGDGCEDKIGSVQDVYYNRQKDRFSDRDAPDRRMGNAVLMTIGGVIGLFGGIYLYTMSKFEWLCHIENSRRLLDIGASNRRNMRTTVVRRDI